MLESLIDAVFETDRKRIIQLEAENKYLKKEIERHQAVITAWMNRCHDLSRRLGKVKVQLIDLQIRSN